MSEPAPIPAIEVLDLQPAADFEAALAPLFEGAPSFLGRLAAARPFGSAVMFWQRALEIARAMPEAAQVELIDAHPRLGAAPASVSALSFDEQGYGRPAVPEPVPVAGTAPAGVAAQLERLNRAYEEQFGFRYCVFVNGRSRAELIPALAAALNADRKEEIQRALADIVAIAQDRASRLGS